jgi:hypothetical protein
MSFDFSSLRKDAPKPPPLRKPGSKSGLSFWHFLSEEEKRGEVVHPLWRGTRKKCEYQVASNRNDIMNLTLYKDYNKEVFEKRKDEDNPIKVIQNLFFDSILELRRRKKWMDVFRASMKRKGYTDFVVARVSRSQKISPGAEEWNVVVYSSL